MIRARSTFLLWACLIAICPVPSLMTQKMTLTSNKSFFDLGRRSADRAGAGRPRGRRQAISADLSAEEIAAYLDKHNELRSQTVPQAANMQYMIWDDDLATMAQQWSDMCIWDHGQPTNISPFSSIGQNLYITSGGTPTKRVDGAGPVQAWFDEDQYYTYDTNTCQTNQVCGHYTQVVWATSYAVGCAQAYCETATGISWEDTIIVTCNYGPAGNYNTQPYLSGTPCTQCESGIGQCYTNQCRLCSTHSEECVCAQVCDNCGTLDSDACTCTCPNGFYGADCSVVCEDTHMYCGANPGWPTSWCDDDHSYVLTNCPALCSLCVAEQDPSYSCDTSASSSAPSTAQPTTNPPTDRASTAQPTTNPPTDRASTAQPTTNPPTDRASTAQPTTNPPTDRASTAQPTTNPPTDRASTAQPTTNPPTDRASTVQPTTNSPTDRVSTQAIPTDSVTVAPTTTCPEVSCSNGGTFDSYSCECMCTSEYQGDMCQHEREQARYGVLVILLADIAYWDYIEPYIIRFIADIVTSFCNYRFELCCPDSGTKNTNERLSYVNESHTVTATGYPEPYPDISSAFVVMFLVTPPAGTDLCDGGTIQPSARKRRDLGGSEIWAWSHGIHKREVGDGPYLDQDVLLEALEENVENLTMALSELNVSVSVQGVAAGQEEPIATEPPQTTDQPAPGCLSTAVIAAIVVVAVLALIVIVVLAVVVFMKSSKQTKIEPSNNNRSTDDGKGRDNYGMTSMAPEA